ncbi:MAG: TonB family protein [Candidatus Eisenbacteria sp.]|nr:TonB family protein [Candidatus Eisenbacteria bacterium]
MWSPDWSDSAHEMFKRQHRVCLGGAALVALLIFGLGAVFAPPYIPSPWELPPDRMPIKMLPPPAIHVPPAPRAVIRPEIYPDFVVDPFADPGVTLPLVGGFDAWIAPAIKVPDVIDPLPQGDPVLVYCATPEYPALAAAMGAEGIVEVLATVDETGKVIAARIVASNATAALEAAALEAARACLFRPAMQGQTPVRCQVVIPFEFALD